MTMAESTAFSVDELKAQVGAWSGTSAWFALDRARIAAFAGVTDDLQDIHLSDDAARRAGFDGVVAHGFLTLSMLSAMARNTLPELRGYIAGLNYGFDKVRFLEPVPAGSRVRAVFHLADVAERTPGRALCRYRTEIVAEGASKPSAVADWLVMILVEPGATPDPSSETAPA
jgi:acyl dehydratase